MNEKQKGYLMRLLKSCIFLFGGLFLWLLSLIPSNISMGISLMSILTFCAGFIDILINIITTFSNPNYFKDEVRF